MAERRTPADAADFARLPSGTVTFLFTDLEGSTRLWEEHPEAMKGALARHDEILRTTIEGHDGYIVKTTGDGVHAAFATAPDAITAAVDAQLALGAEDWPATGALLVRMGIHTGAAELREGDYYGTSLNRAARLMSAAHGRQIVVSQATVDLARDDLADGVVVVDLGDHRLRDLSRAERVFQVHVPGMTAEFPPLRTLDAFPSNLPSQLSSFVGRTAELDAVAAALESARLVTITGVGGVGKTRLAVHVAAQLLPAFVDGAWLCELAAASDGDALDQVVAGALRAPSRPMLTVQQSIVEFLRGRALLLILDNCEHLIDAAGALAEHVLRECPDVRILATSREGLAVEGEQVRSLRSLPVPGADARGSAIGASDAVALFVERAQAARPGFALDEVTAPAVAEICRRLDGIPLAIELAAARLGSMNPTEIAGLLDERFRLLTGGRRSAVERHQTLRATVDWSYSLLSPVEQQVFDRLGVFAGSFDASAVTAVATGDGVATWDVLDAVASLVAKSMVTTNQAIEGATRYHLLETLRQYARDRLDERGDVDIWRRSHAAYFANFADQAGSGLRSREELAWRRRIDEELDDVRAAVTWSLDSTDDDDGEFAVRIVAALAAEANTSASSFGVGDWAERALAAAARSTPGRRSDVQAAAGWSALNRGDLDGARALGLQAVDGGVPVDSSAPSVGYVLLGFLELINGRGDLAAERVAEGLAALEAFPTPMPADRATIAVTAGAYRAFEGDMEGAVTEATEALRLAREVGSASILANALTIVVVATWVDDPRRAEPLLDEAIELVRTQGGAGVMFPIMLVIRAQLRLGDSDPAAAIAALRESVDFLQDRGDLPQLVTVLDYGIQTLANLGNAEAAGVLAGFSLDGPLAPLGNMPPSLHPRRTDALERSRAVLGDDGLAAARRRGAAMGPDDVVAYTLRELDRMSEEPGGD